jgi:hypothetical protein
MKSEVLPFNTLVENLYSLSLEERLEIKSLLENNISESKRDVILAHYQKSKKEHLNGNLKFSSKMADLKEML